MGVPQPLTQVTDLVGSLEVVAVRWGSVEGVCGDQGPSGKKGTQVKVSNQLGSLSQRPPCLSDGGDMATRAFLEELGGVGRAIQLCPPTVPNPSPAEGTGSKAER